MGKMSTLSKTVDELKISVGNTNNQRRGNYAGRIECFNCHKMGHYAKDCYQAKRPPQHFSQGQPHLQAQGQFKGPIQGQGQGHNQYANVDQGQRQGQSCPTTSTTPTVPLN